MKIDLSLCRAAFFSAVLVISLFILNAASFAATFTVTNLNDSGAGSLRQAILDANANMNGPGVVDEIVFAFGVTGTILADGEMVIKDDVTITGPGANLLTIDAQTNDRIFNINDGVDLNDIVVSISGLRFINGLVHSGGAIFNNEELSIDSCVFEDNEAEILGGAIRNNGTITAITHSTFSGNIGHAIVNLDTMGEITHSTFSGNIDDFGGAIFNLGTIGEITHSTFSGNMADDLGGAIYNGGTIDEITHSTFSGNMADDNGGAIWNNGRITAITHSIFNGNIADFGGAIFNLGTIEKITNSTFDGNEAAFAGGAIFNQTNGTIEKITNSTFSGNEANNDGGAIWNDGEINISFTTIANNMASAGGGIFNDETLNIKNSIVGDNTPDNCDGAAVTAIGADNLDTDGTCTGFDTVASNILNLDPTGLQNNGGPTQTIALCTGMNTPGAGCLAVPSVAIDAIMLATVQTWLEVP